jgi:hypothetical protein
MNRDKQEFEVELVVTRHHLFTTFSRTAEEAVSDAEMLLEDGDDGQILSTDIEMSDAFPVGDEPREADEDDDMEDEIADD